MIARELLAELSIVRSAFHWSYNGPKRQIRARLKAELGGPLLDPIGAVCFSKTGLIFYDDQWFAAARRLNLSHIDAADLTAAANNVSSESHSMYLCHLRVELINRITSPSQSHAASAAAATAASGRFRLFLRSETQAVANAWSQLRRLAGTLHWSPRLQESNIRSAGKTSH